MLRQRLVLIFSLVAMLFGVALVALPTDTAYACLPCDCPDNTSVNCFGPYQLYTDPDDDGECFIDIWIIEEGQGVQALTVSAEDLAELPEAEDIEEGYVLIDDAYNGYLTLYKLQTGEFQLNVGPDVEGKVHFITWTGCPAEETYESTFVLGA